MKSFVKNSIINTRFFIKDNKIHLIFITLFTVGIVIGSFSFVFSGEKIKTITDVLNAYFNENTSLSVMALFSRNLISIFIYLAVMYVGGLCAIGLPFVGILPLVKGIGLGAIISYQYIFSGAKGFLYTFVLILIPSALLLAVLSFAYVEGIYMSLTVSNGIFNGKPRQVKYSLSFMTFTKRYLIFSIALIIISLLEAIICYVFSKILM